MGWLPGKQSAAQQCQCNSMAAPMMGEGSGCVSLSLSHAWFPPVCSSCRRALRVSTSSDRCSCNRTVKPCHVPAAAVTVSSTPTTYMTVPTGIGGNCKG
jgi:hypothetical protein